MLSGIIGNALIQAGSIDYGALVLAETPLVWYRFNETAAATGVVDSSGNALHGTYVDVSDGDLGQASITNNDETTCWKMDGVDARADVSAIDVPFRAMLANDWTMEFWYKTTDEARQEIVTLYGGATPYVTVRLNTDAAYNDAAGRIKIYLADVNSHKIEGGSPTDVSFGFTDGNPHHFVFKAYPSAGNLKLYIDGVEKTLTLGTTNALAGFTAGLSVSAHIGHYNASYPVDGTIDNFALYAKSLSEATILAHYNAGKPAA